MLNVVPDSFLTARRSPVFVFVSFIHVLDGQNLTNINYRNDNIVSSLSVAYLQKTKQTEMHKARREEKKNKPKRNKISWETTTKGKTHRCPGTKDDLGHWLY